MISVLGGDDAIVRKNHLKKLRLRFSGIQNLKKNAVFTLYRTALTYARGVDAGNHR